MSINVNSVTSGVESSDHVVQSSAKVMVNGDVLFNVVGDIGIRYIVSECYTANNATASTVQYSVTANATTTTISGASASLASAAIGQAILLQPTALATAPILTTASGVGLNILGEVRAQSGSQIKVIVGVGSTTGTWKHYIRYEPLEIGAYVTAAF
jgi:hypothetical protein